MPLSHQPAWPLQWSHYSMVCYNYNMKQHHKVGNRKGRPAYRTPSNFIIRRGLTVRQQKVK